jgi:mannosyltransferase
VLVAALSIIVSFSGAGRPSLWYDEAATISAASRPLPELWAMLGNVDAVHGVYYLTMHGWLMHVAPTESLLRLSSALTVGLTAAGIVVLAKQLSTRSVALTAGVLFAVLPRVTWAGIEARSYALSMAVAVWLTVMCVSAARARRGWPWPLYCLALTLSALVNVYVLFIVAAHAVVIALITGRRSAVLGWLTATVIGIAAATPFLLFARTQLAQVSWIFPLGSHTFGDVFIEQYFDKSIPFAVLAAVAVVAALLFRRPGSRLPEGSGWQLVIVALTWIVVPTAALLGASAWWEPLYYPRYLTFTAPAMALLLGVCVVAIARSRWVIVAALAVFTVAAMPNYVVVQRGPYAKEGMDFSQVADVIDRYAAPGDCLVLDNTVTWKPGPIRPLTAARPETYAKLVDPGRGARAVDRKRLWDRHIPIWLWADRLPTCPVLWTVSERDTRLPDHQVGPALAPGPRLASAPAYQIPLRYGFHVVERWQFSFAQVAESIRTRPHWSPHTAMHHDAADAGPHGSRHPT